MPSSNRVLALTSEGTMWVCPQCHAAFVEGRFCPHDGVALRGDEPHVPGLVIEHEIGRGLTGAVWRARGAGGHAVALKVLHRDWATHHEMRERFLREARAAASVVHPCVVAPLAVGTTEDGRPYIVMELVDGPSLEEVLALGPLPVARAAAIAADVASALAAAHRAGVVHRDVKPGNIKIARDGRARLLDFGVAYRLDVDEARLTQGGLTVGTPHYMAPEQCTGDVITGRTDVYALGCVLYRMLSGEVPFDGAAVAVMLAHAAREPVPLRARSVAAPAELEALVRRCLAKRPLDRPDAEALAEELTALATGRPRRSSATRVRLGRASTMPAASTDDEESITRTQPVAPLARRRHWGRWIAAAASFAIALLVLNATELGHDVAHRLGVHVHPDLPYLDGPQPAVAAEPRPFPENAAWHRFVVAIDDGISLRLGAPATLRTGRDQELTIEAWDVDGEPIDTTDMVVTFAGPGGALVGFAAEPTRERGVYRVRTRFAEPGEWLVHVFPPHGNAMVTFHLEVGDARRDG